MSKINILTWPFLFGIFVVMPLKAKRVVSRSVTVMPKRKAIGLNGYQALVKTVRQELEELDFFIRRRTAESYWRVGKFIHEHLLQGRDRAEHGINLFDRLARDVDRDSSTLQKMVRFYRAYPNLAPGPDLSWSHYRVLISIKDAGQRKKLEKKIADKKWDTRQLQKHLRAGHRDGKVLADNKPVPRLKVTRGRLNIYKILATDARNKDGELLIDYGFGVRRPLAQGKKDFKDGDLITGNGRGYTKIDIDDKLRYTYQAYVERVVDGDTLLVLIEGGAGNLVEERLRLRGIDCPERDTEPGRKAKRFVERRLGSASFIIIRTYREEVDRYARYLADVFYGNSNAAKTAAEGTFLNQELLNAHLAVGY